ncbi:MULTISPECIES: DUF305 domain-containing protein [unclassified Rhizobium]|uniref:DUF305 domain-containing protein n=1 Tax=unclassified Rhizobium TaxID=2613769 RepID=UPI0009E91D76|nr:MULTISPECIES: DUF305 domain-containing protein [unclassified Rhizobium]MBP2460192.1 uncharacterized protein (DUF305 family) [Rhizobium sp. PvP014]MBP2527589.1 uncharacterized protein (DUF305 family) [Rhizobium sp. PvP099]
MRAKVTVLIATAVGISLCSLSPALSEQQHQHHQPEPAGKNETADAFSASMKAAMEKMHAGMMSVSESGNPDRDFLAQMIPHHQGAVDMAKAVLVSTKDPQIRNLAQSIITEQTYEIQLMHAMLDKSGNQPAATPETVK